MISVFIFGTIIAVNIKKVEITKRTRHSLEKLLENTENHEISRRWHRLQFNVNTKNLNKIFNSVSCTIFISLNAVALKIDMIGFQSCRMTNIYHHHVAKKISIKLLNVQLIMQRKLDAMKLCAIIFIN